MATKKSSAAIPSSIWTNYGLFFYCGLVFLSIETIHIFLFFFSPKILFEAKRNLEKLLRNGILLRDLGIVGISQNFFR